MFADPFIQVVDDPGKRDSLTQGLDGFLERARDRALFDLPPKPAAIPARGRFPIPMETAALSPAFLPDSQIFVSTDPAAPTTCSLTTCSLLHVYVSRIGERIE